MVKPALAPGGYFLRVSARLEEVLPVSLYIFNEGIEHQRLLEGMPLLIIFPQKHLLVLVVAIAAFGRLGQQEIHPQPYRVMFSLDSHVTEVSGNRCEGKTADNPRACV